MKKIALVLLSDYSKSWIDSGNLAELSEASKLTVFGSPAVIGKIQSLNLNLLTRELPEIEASRATRILQMVSMINRRSLSTSFGFRLKRLMFGELRVSPNIEGRSPRIHALAYNLKRAIRFTISHPVETLAFCAPIGRVLESQLRARFEKYSREKFSSFNFSGLFDLVLLPSAATEDRIYEFIEFLKYSKAKTAICIENWDNLTSKAILISHPDYVFVMGDYCKNHGEKIQALLPSQIVVAGLPRFNPYRTLHSRSSSVSTRDTFTILYLGFSVPHNEKNLVNELVSLLENSELRGKYRFLYKPHPVRQKRFYESDRVVQTVNIIDDNLGITGPSALPAINERHIETILDANVVIATPTSMAIESMLLGIPTIIDATDDGVHRTTARISLESYLHLRDLRKIRGVFFGQTSQEIFSELQRHYFGMAPTDRPSLENLIESKDTSYVSHITELANRI